MKDFFRIMFSIAIICVCVYVFFVLSVSGLGRIKFFYDYIIGGFNA